MLFLSCFLLCFRARLFIDSLWSPAGKGLTSELSIVYLRSCHFPIGILGQVWCLIVSIPDLCPFSYFNAEMNKIEICKISYLYDRALILNVINRMLF